MQRPALWASVGRKYFQGYFAHSSSRYLNLTFVCANWCCPSLDCRSSIVEADWVLGPSHL